MSDVIAAPIEVVQTHGSDDDECWHIVCHCTGDDIAACGLDVSLRPFVDDDSEPVCPLCMVAWPDGAPTCPWGCDCEDECGPECFA